MGRLLTVVLAGALLAGYSSSGFAFGSIGDAWVDHYDLGVGDIGACAETILLDARNDCTACHPNAQTDQLNGYGQDMFDYRDANGGTWIGAIAAIGGDDSDGDGVSNDDECSVDCTLPGDPLSVPTEESTWSQIKGYYR